MNIDEAPVTALRRGQSPRPSVALGHAIRKTRSGRYTLAQLSDRSGVSAGLLSLIERGRGNPSINTLASIAEALDISLPELVADAVEHAQPAQALVATLRDAPVEDAEVPTVVESAAQVVATSRPADLPVAWQTSVMLRGGQEAHVRVLDGTLELTLHDRTIAEQADGTESSRPLSVDLSLRSLASPAILRIPPVEDPRWIEFARGEIPFEPSTLACQMLVTHVLRCVRQDPSSPNVERWIRELRGFFVKYESVSGPELAQLFG